MLKDALVFDGHVVTPNTVNILISKEVKKSQILKSITFDNFLNIVLKIAKAKYPLHEASKDSLK